MLLAAAAGWAQPAPQPKVSLTVQDAPLAEVARALTEQAGQVVSVSRGVARRRVSLQIASVPLPLALQLLGEVTGLQVSASEGVYVIHRAGDSPGGAFRPLREETEAPPPADRDRVKKIRHVCRHVPPSTIAAAFGQPALVQGETGIEMVRAAHRDVTVVSGYLGKPAAGADPASLALIQDAAVRAEQRWSAAGHPHGLMPDHQCDAALRLPAGVLAVIGFDPSSTLVAVGRPEAVDEFAKLAAQLDVPSTRIELRATAFVVPAGALPAAVAGSVTPLPGGHASIRLALGDAAEVVAALGRVNGVETYALEPLVAGNAEAVAFSLSVPIEVGGQGDFGVATTDVKVAAMGAEGGLSLSLEAAYGEVAVRLPGATGAGAAMVRTAVPVLSHMATLPAGRALAWSGVLPVEPYRAPDAAAQLAQLPLVGELYRVAGAPAAARQVVLVLTARTLAP